jgi:hypothetical protein
MPPSLLNSRRALEVLKIYYNHNVLYVIYSKISISITKAISSTRFRLVKKHVSREH